MSKIIVADDDKTILKIYDHILAPLGHECRYFSNGRDAIDSLRSEWADLVILDCSMPVMNGYETCREIRAMPEAKDLPIIIVSADDSQDNILKLLNAGANDYVLKPIREAVIVTKLKNFLKTTSLSGRELDILHGKTEVAGRYKIQKVLGYGSHSIVFLAEDKERDGVNVAVKLLNGDAVDESLGEKILAMAEALKNAGSFENILRVIDLGRHDGTPYIILEYADGGDLAVKFKNDAPLSELETVDIALDCANGLLELETAGLTHLDLKPENILQTDTGLKLADFGIFIEEDTTKTISLNSEILTTAAYSPPEVFLESDELSIASDIYSLGILLYEALTGDNPFKATKASTSMFRQLNQKPPKLCDVVKQCSVELSQLIDAMLSKEMDDRPTPTSVLEELRKIKTELTKGRQSNLTYGVTNRLANAEGGRPSSAAASKKRPAKAPTNRKTPSKSLDGKQSEEAPFPSFKKAPTKLERILNKPFVKIAVAIAIFAAVYLATHLATNLFAGSSDEVLLKGVPSVVICPKCGNVEVKDVADITKTRCSKCGAQEWFAEGCAKCHRIFPMDESKFDDSDIDDIDQLDQEDKCPYCGSSDIRPVTPNNLKSWQK